MCLCVSWSGIFLLLSFCLAVPILSGHKVMAHGLGLIARQRFEFKLRCNGRDIPFRVPRRSIRCRPLDSARAAAGGPNLFQARFGCASVDEVMMERILAGLWAVVARICDFLLRRNTEAAQQLFRFV